MRSESSRELALLVEATRGNFVAAAADDASIGREHRAVERDDGRVVQRIAEAKRRLRVTDDDRVADERTNERFVFGRITKRIGEATHDAFAFGRLRRRTRDEARARWNDRSATTARTRHFFEERERAIHVRRDDVFEAIAEQTRERVCELGGRFDSIADQARERRVARRDERARPRGRAFEPRMNFGERLMARAHARELGARFFERLLACDDRFAQLREAHFGALAIFRARDLASAHGVHAGLERAHLAVVLGERAGERLAFELRFIETRRHLGGAPVVTRERRLCARDGGLRACRVRRALLRACFGVGELARRLGETRFVRFGLRALQRFVLLEIVNLALERRALFRERIVLRGDVACVALRLRFARAERFEAVLAARDRRFLGAHVVLRRERTRLRALDFFFDRERFLARSLELRIARRELRARALRIARLHVDFFGVELLPPDELEIFVRRLVELKILDLAPIREIPLGLLRLALQRSEVALDLRDDVADAKKVLRAELHLSLGGLLARFVFRDARGLFDEQAPIFRLRADDQTDLALLDDRVRLRPDARAEEQIRDVLQADLDFVDQIFAVAVAMKATRDGDLGVVGELGRQRGGLVVFERERDLGHLARGARVRAAEEHVLHAATAEVLRALLAHATSELRRRCSTCRSRWARRCRGRRDRSEPPCGRRTT